MSTSTRGIRAFILAVVTALCVGAGGYAAYHWTGADPGDPQGKTPAGSGRPAVPATAGTTDVGGPDATAFVAQRPQERPAGWQSWQGRFARPPLACAADPRAVACLLVDGTYEALSAVDGRRLWTAGTPEGKGEMPGDGEAYVAPNGDFYVGGDGVPPVLQGGRALISLNGRVELRDSADGRRLWTSPGGLRIARYPHRPGISGDAVLVSGYTDDYVPVVEAYALDSGVRLWRVPLGPAVQDAMGEPVYRLRAVRGGQAYATAVGSGSDTSDLVRIDVAGGRIAARLKGLPVLGCAQVMALRRNVACELPQTSTGESGTLLLDPRTLARGATAHLPEGSLVAADDTNALVYDATRSTLTAARWEQGTRTGEATLVHLPDQSAPASSTPLLIGARALTVDYTTLRLLSLPGLTGHVIPVPEAPRERVLPTGDPMDGRKFTDTLRPPQVLALGGVAHIVYDDASVVSLALPE
ncbi:hypothetical protein AB0M28_22055 [Streptomyces sp. NPDC051940]|uniref:hypothetical protein n=1 Tax=Streptomyces sp. NPDC051940 TaxID=3155675 RepID=UPI00341BAFF6